MSLFSKKNIDKAKDLALKNKEKISSGVTKATDTIDKKTGGKYTGHLKKVDDAAKKFGGDAEAGTDDRDRLRPDESEGTAADLHADPDAPKPEG
jgi:hypothetical protein